MYIKKAATFILAVAIVLWAMMTFPGSPDRTVEHFDQRVTALETAFLNRPGTNEIFPSKKELEAFGQYRERLKEGDLQELRKEDPAFCRFSQVLSGMKRTEGRSSLDQSRTETERLAASSASFVEQRQIIEQEKQTAALRNTIGGRLGVALDYVFKPLDFDWRTNIALVGGFAAKEVVVSTLGTAYSLGEVDPEDAGNLSEKLKTEPGCNALKAFTLILFVMLYAPCFATLVVMRKETGGWQWPLFAVVYTTGLAYGVAVTAYPLGSLFGFGAP